MSSVSLPNALNLLNILRDYIIEHDIPKAIEGKSNYLAALGLSTYTEILGGLYYGDLSGNLGHHYICFINEFFPEEYMTVNADLEKDGLRGLYGAVRSGLTHEYFIKKRSQIVIEDDPSSVSCGIFYNPRNDPHIIFYVRKYFEDFKHAFEKHYNQLQSDNSGKLLSNFDNALKSINSALTGVIDKPDFRSGASGSGAVTMKYSRNGFDNR